MKWVLNAIKKFLHLFSTVSRIEFERELRKLRVFDIVSNNPHPYTDELYMIYSFNDTDIYLTKWNQYFKHGLFNAGKDTQYVYRLDQAENALYKVANFSIRPRSIIQHASVAEMNTIGMRLTNVYHNDPPLMGVFKDTRDDHMMIVADKINDEECVVYDMAVAPTSGAYHFHQFAHVCRIKDLMSQFEMRPMTAADIVCSIQGPWNPKVLDDYLQKLFNAIRTTEVKLNKYSVYCRGLTESRKTSAKTKTKQKKEQK